MSIFPVGLDLPPPIRPITFLSAARKLCSRSCHCVSSSVRWTRTRVFTPRLAITAAAVTVLPKAVGAQRTPVSCCSVAPTATSWSSRSVPAKRTSICAPDDARFVPDREAHGLCLVELRVLEGRQANETVGQCLREPLFREVDQVGERQVETLG